MKEEEILSIVTSELLNPEFATTIQYTDIHQPEKNGDDIKIDRITFDNEGCIIVYVPVVDELFHFKIYIDKLRKEFISINTEPYNRVYFNATSDKLRLKDLEFFTKLKSTDSWSIGDFRRNNKSKYNFTRFSIMPNPEPDSFENKIIKLLDLLESDKTGIQKLIENSEASIVVASNFHYGNGMIGGYSICSNVISRLNSFNLSVEFDLYVNGEGFKD